MKTLTDPLYIAWVIGTKDIREALKNKAMLNNIIVMAGMVVFFYFLNILRPFDQEVSVVVYDQGNTSLAFETVTLGDGAKYSFREASSLPEMEQKMAYQSLGLVLPADLDQTLADGSTPTLSGYIFWVDRKKTAELESKYSQAFSTILNQPVQVVIGSNIVIPQANSDGMQTSVAYLMVYFVFWTALALVPLLMLEEKRTKTLDALLTSQASPGQIVLGKALAGFFYILVIGGLAMILFAAYFVHWGLALAAFLGYALFAIGIALGAGSLLKSTRQLGIWSVALILILVIPPLFFMESNLKPVIRAVFTWFPTSALASLLRFACSSNVTLEQYLPNLVVAMVSIGLVFGLVIWRVRQIGR